MTYKPTTEEEIQLNSDTEMLKKRSYALFSLYSDRIVKMNKKMGTILIKDKNKNIYYTVSLNVKKVKSFINLSKIVPNNRNRR